MFEDVKELKIGDDRVLLLKTDENILYSKYGEPLKDINNKVLKAPSFLKPLLSLVWNNVIDANSGTLTSNGITYTYNGDGSYILSGTATSYSYNLVRRIPIVVIGHKYLIGGDPSKKCFLSCYTSAINLSSKVDPSSSWSANTYASIHNADSNSDSKVDGNIYTNMSFGIFVNDYSQSMDGVTVTPFMIDLTDMFGLGNEPETADAFALEFGYNSIEEFPYFNKDYNGEYIMMDNKLFRIHNRNLVDFDLNSDNYSSVSNFRNNTSGYIEDEIYHTNGYQSSSSTDTSFYIASNKYITLPSNTLVYLSFKLSLNTNISTFFRVRQPTNFTPEYPGLANGNCVKLIGSSDLDHGVSNLNNVIVGTNYSGRVILPIITTSDTLYKISLGYDDPNLYGEGSYCEFSEVMITLSKVDGEVYKKYEEI